MLRTMTTKTALSLLLLGVLITSVYSHLGVNDAWKCNHDEIDHPKPDRIQVEEKGFKEAKEGRSLQSSNYPNIRMYGYYGFLSGAGSDYESYMSEMLIPPILSFFEGALKVKYPISGPLRIGSYSICGQETPQVLLNGVNADFIYIFASESASGTWVASTSSCSLASGSSRPLVGMTTINTALFRSATNDVLLHERNMYAIMHELTHTLGFSTSLYPYFVDENGNTLQGHIKSGYLDGYSATVLDIAPLTARVQAYFGCASAPGAYMENQGAAGAVSGSHWERRHYGFEAMTAYLLYEMKYSALTFALLEGTGWYVPDYSYADPFFWGQGEGCSFLTSSANYVQQEFSEFCYTSSLQCAVPGRGAGSCVSDPVSDGMYFSQPTAEYDCENPDGAQYAQLAGIQTFGRGTGSKCFQGTIGRYSQTTFCFVGTCSGSGSNTVLNLQVGGRTVACTSAGNVNIPGYSGTITCPDPQTWCSTVGQSICPRGCMGRGQCVQGTCQCYNGFAGEDCALPA